MKHAKLWLVLLVTMIVSVGCAQGTSPNENTAKEETQQENTESDLSPTKEQTAAKHTVTLFFADRELMKLYRVDKEVEVGNESELPKAALEAWIKGPDHEKLSSLVPPAVVVEYVTAEDNVAQVSFSKELKNANVGSTGEVMIIDQIALIMKQFGYDSTQIRIEGNIEETLLGHMSAQEPYQAKNPDDIERIE